LIIHGAVRCVAHQKDETGKLPGGPGKEFDRDRKVRAWGEREGKNEPCLTEVVRVKRFFAEHDAGSPGVRNC
jgi:hypothetical protein